MDRRALLSLFILPVVLPVSGLAAQIGSNPPNTPVTAERIAELPAAERVIWQKYLDRSNARRHADQSALLAERKGLHLVPADPVGGDGIATMPLDRDQIWYSSPAALEVANNILSFQTPAGGWSKNQPRNAPVRKPGQAFVRGGSTVIYQNIKLPPKLPRWDYVGTIDNGATSTEIRFLLKFFAATRNRHALKSATKGIRYLLNAQMPNGGWPQVWPLQGGYHDCITLNDNAMVNVLNLLSDIFRGSGEFAAVPTSLRKRAGIAVNDGIDLLLKAQIIVDGRRTLWAQQFDALTLTPASAREYESPSLATLESTGVLIFLMAQPKPTPLLTEAVTTAVSCLDALKIEGMVFTEVTPNDGRRLVPKAGAGRLWARCYHLKSLTPVFGYRGGTIHDTVDDLDAGRRNGYAWYVSTPKKALDEFPRWAASTPAA